MSRRRRRRSAPLFVSRKFPPSVGGMQTLAAGVWRAVRDAEPGARLIAHRGGNRSLPLWLLTALPHAAILMKRRRVDSVLTGDALTYALLRPFIRAARLPHATMVMGLDITYPNPLYRAFVHRALRRSPRVIAISHATARAVEQIGVPRDRISVIRLGVKAPPVSDADRARASAALRDRLGVDDETVVMLTVGRLVRRKGIDWFMANVIPRLPAATVYVVAGSGPDAALLRSTAARLGLATRVRLLGQVDNAERETLLRGADLFVQPNVHVQGDIEGFGLVVIEAAMRGTPIVASAVDGIVDAVVDGETGILMPPGSADEWIERLTALITDARARRALGERFASASRAHYDEGQMGRTILGMLGRRSEFNPAVAGGGGHRAPGRGRDR